MAKKISPLWVAGLLVSLASCVDDHAVSTDWCPEDDNKLQPGICGCGVEDVDTDGDGTLDCLDECSEDAGKIEPGVCGCGVADVDTNGNTVPDCLDTGIDLCPEDPEKTLPGVCGCGVADVDADEDGAFACHDACEDDPAKTKAGVCGCGVPDVDADGDGVLDCEEACPLDGSKTEAGVCGCGVPDVDSDGDGVLDCEDACPQDSAKQAVGVCGCGFADAGQNLGDDDGDGVINCLDLCPDNPIKSEPGKNGCGAMDSDGDGVEDDDDYCPHNPNIMQNDGRDCNYNADGEFEIWSTSDLKRLHAELTAKAPAGNREGMKCDKLGEFVCAEPGVSSKMSVCIDFSAGDRHEFRYADDDCGAGFVCGLENDSYYACILKNAANGACTELADPPVVGNCCDMGTTASTCSDGKRFYCDGDRYAEETCEYGCADASVCASCRATETPSQVGDCCDPSWSKTCVNGEVLSCVNGKLKATACQYGCGDASSCMVCRSVETPAQVGDCCTSETFAARCDGSGRMYCDYNGVVAYEECIHTCYTVADDSAAQCQTDLPDTWQYTKVKLMRDIDIHETISCDNLTGNWQQVDLFRVDFDGQGHSITFTQGGSDVRCGITRPLFRDVIDSRIHDLKLDFDLRGGAEGALADSIYRSNIKDVTWTGTATIGGSIYGEVNRGTAILAAIAGYSLFENVGMTGKIDIMSGSYAGLIGEMIGTRLEGATVALEDVVMRDTKISSSFSSVAGSIYEASVITDVDVDLLNLDLMGYMPRVAGVFNQVYDRSSVQNTDVLFHEIELYLHEDYHDIYIYGIGSSLNEGKISGVKVHMDKVRRTFTNADLRANGSYQNEYIYIYLGLGSGYSSLNEFSDLTLSISDVKFEHSYDEITLDRVLGTLCMDMSVYSNISIRGLGNYIYGNHNNIDIDIEDIDYTNMSKCYCGCLDHTFYVNVASVADTIYASVKDVDVTLNQIKANTVYGLASTIGSNGSIQKARVHGDRIHADSNLYFLAGTLSSNTNSSTSSGKVALSHVTAEFTNVHATNAYAINQYYYGRHINGVAVYADAYVKYQSSTSSASSFIRYFYNSSSNTTDNYLLKLRNVMTAIRFKRYNSYTLNDMGEYSYNMYTGANFPTVLSTIYNSSTTYFDVRNFYWLKRYIDESPSNYVLSLFSEFSINAASMLIDTLSNDSGMTWEVKSVMEDGTKVEMPWIKD